jgi:tRNA(adenine34) deaminase
MREALAEARKAYKKNEVPVGAVLVKRNKIVARAHNLTRHRKNPVAHAEILLFGKAAAKLRNERFLDTTLYVTLEPCAMCAGAIVQARIPTVVYGTKDPKAGACGSALKVIPHKKLNHRPQVVAGILGDESSQLLKIFFRARRS